LKTKKTPQADDVQTAVKQDIEKGVDSVNRKAIAQGQMQEKFDALVEAVHDLRKFAEDQQKFGIGKKRFHKLLAFFEAKEKQDAEWGVPQTQWGRKRY
jgi:hypothetical protein